MHFIRKILFWEFCMKLEIKRCSKDVKSCRKDVESCKRYAPIAWDSVFINYDNQYTEDTYGNKSCSYPGRLLDMRLLLGNIFISICKYLTFKKY